MIPKALQRFFDQQAREFILRQYHASILGALVARSSSLSPLDPPTFDVMSAEAMRLARRAAAEEL